jgi:hypothetical protein
MWAAGTIPHEQLVPGLRRHFRWRAGSDVLFAKVIGGDRGTILLSPVCGELVEGWDEVAPLGRSSASLSAHKRRN